MLLIFPKPEEITSYHSLAVNLKSYDEIIAFKNNDSNLFSLDLNKLHDGHRSNQSTSYYTLGIFQSSDACLKLFEEIVDALNAGQQTFKLPLFDLPTQPEPPDRQDRRFGYN